MWTYTTDGFFSVAQDKDEAMCFCIKGRNLAHLESAAQWLEDNAGFSPEIEFNQQYDYVVRMSVLKELWVQYMTAKFLELDYTSNVKGHIMHETDPELGHAMLDQWSRMVEYQVEMHPGSAQDLGWPA